MKRTLIALALAASIPAHADKLDTALRMVDDEIANAYWKEAKVYKDSCDRGSAAACSLYRDMLQKAKQNLLTMKARQQRTGPRTTPVMDQNPQQDKY